MAGAVVEAVSGLDYYEYLRRHIYATAGLHSSDSFDIDADVPNLATGYSLVGPNGDLTPGPYWTNHFRHVAKGGPAGGGYSTVDDMLNFATALLDATHTDLVLRPKAITPSLRASSIATASSRTPGAAPSASRVSDRIKELLTQGI